MLLPKKPPKKTLKNLQKVWGRVWGRFAPQRKKHLDFTLSA